MFQTARMDDFGPRACCEPSPSGASRCLFVSVLQCSQQERHEMAVRFPPNTWEKKKNTWLSFNRPVLHKNSNFWIAASNFLTYALSGICETRESSGGRVFIFC